MSTREAKYVAMRESSRQALQLHGIVASLAALIIVYTIAPNISGKFSYFSCGATKYLLLLIPVFSFLELDMSCHLNPVFF